MKKLEYPQSWSDPVRSRINSNAREQALEFFTISPQYKNANIANFVSALP